MSGYPSAETYAALYARYLKRRPPTELLDVAGVKVKGKVVWDLCAGGGDLSRACIRKGAKKVVAIDGSHDMLRPLYDWKRERKRGASRLEIACCSMETLFPFYEERPDLVFCRQAINYWLHPCRKSVGFLAQRMKPGGKFIFNTFNKRPSAKPVVKGYDFEGHHFVEISWRVPETKMVHHVQVRDGMEPHVTKFRWMTEGDFFRILSPHFAMGVVTEGRTDIYVCTRR